MSKSRSAVVEMNGTLYIVVDEDAVWFKIRFPGMVSDWDDRWVLKLAVRIVKEAR